MNYYDTTQILNILKRASEGDGNARVFIKKINQPCAVVPDYSVMILVQEKCTTINAQGMVEILNMPPEDNGISRQIADIFQCDRNGSLWSYIPIPVSFVVNEMNYSDGTFCFIANNNKTIAGNLSQIKKSMFEVTFALGGATEPEIERCFFAIPSTVIPLPAPLKTAAETQAIDDDVIGRVNFDERLQWFKGNYQKKRYSFEIVFETNDRNEVVNLLTTIHHIFSRFVTFDQTAREYAANALLDLKNENWREEGENLITKDDFISRMSIDTVSFEVNGKCSIWYADGDLFWGHSITVYINIKGEPERAEING